MKVSGARPGTGWQPTDHTDTPHVILKLSPCPADLPGWRSAPSVQGPHLYPSWPPLSDHAGLASQNAFGLLARTCSTLCRRPLCGRARDRCNKTGVLQDSETDLLTPLLAENARAQGVQRFAGKTYRSLRQPQRGVVIPEITHFNWQERKI